MADMTYSKYEVKAKKHTNQTRDTTSPVAVLLTGLTFLPRMLYKGNNMAFNSKETHHLVTYSLPDRPSPSQSPPSRHSPLYFHRHLRPPTLTRIPLHCRFP